MKRPIVFVAGHRGMVGSAIVKALQNRNDCEILTQTRDELDLRDQSSVYDFFATNPIDKVYLAAAKVGGIFANNHFPANFIFENMQIQNNIIGAAHKTNVQKLMFLGSSCIYPRLSPQPIKEEYLLSGPLEFTNEPYAVAKIAGIKLCESFNRQYNRDYRSVMPCNLYGRGDNYHSDNSHVIPALIRRFHEAKLNKLPYVTIWGTGTPRREFLNVIDLAEASIHLMDTPLENIQKYTNPTCSHINVGFGSDITIYELATLIAKVIEYSGDIEFDQSKPDGTPRKLLDCSKTNALGWKPTIDLIEGLKDAYQDFMENIYE